MIVTKTPTRVSFVGGGTDYPEWFMSNGGAVLGVTINQYCYIGFHKNGEMWKCFDVPTRSGLATSSAFTIGLLRATTNLDKIPLARLAIEWERDKSGNNVGFQDQYLCSLGGMRHIKFSDQGVEPEPIEFPTSLQDNLMLFNTGARIMGGYSVIQEQLSGIKQHASILRQIHALVDEALKVLDSPDFGRLLGEEWQLKRQLGEHVSTPEIDSIYDKAIKAGAIGGKLLGAGGGGFILLYVEPDKRNYVKKQLNLAETPFKFDPEGTRIVYSE